MFLIKSVITIIFTGTNDLFRCLFSILHLIYLIELTLIYLRLIRMIIFGLLYCRIRQKLSSCRNRIHQLVIFPGYNMSIVVEYGCCGFGFGFGCYVFSDIFYLSFEYDK